MKRTDRRTPLQVAVAALTHKIDLPDVELCDVDHRTAPLPAPHRPCGRTEMTDQAHTVTCERPGVWGYQVPGYGVRRGCTAHAAAAVRARLWLQRQQLIVRGQDK